MIYIITFIIVILLTFILEKILKKQTKKSKKILVTILFIIPVFILSLLAGLRTENIGTDVRIYVKPVFEHAESFDNLGDMLSSKRFTIEPGYLILNFIISRFTDNLNILMFILEFIICACVFKGLYNFRDKFPMWLGVAVFCLLFYNRTYNIVRQCIAIFIIFANLRYLLDRKYVRYFITVLVAATFHVTALIMLVMPFMRNKKIRIASIVILIIGFIFYNPILEFLASKMSFGSKFLTYLNKDGLDINFLDEALRVLLITFLVYMGSFKKEYQYKLDFLTFVIFDFIILQFGMWSTFVTRAAWYFLSSYIILIPYVINLKEEKKKRDIVIILGALSVYWMYSFVYLGLAETYPYESILF